MGTILSTIAAIENIRWLEPKKGRVYNAKRIMFVDETTAIIELENGSYTVAGRRHGPNKAWAISGYGIDSFGQSVLHGLARIGLLKAADVKEHIATVEERHKARERKHTIRHLRELCEQLGVEAPAIEE